MPGEETQVLDRAVSKGPLFQVRAHREEPAPQLTAGSSLGSRSSSGGRPEVGALLVGLKPRDGENCPFVEG